MREIIKFTLLSLLIVIPFRLYIAQPFIVEGASMLPTFESGHYLIVDQLSYHFKSPHRGSILVFRYPRDPSKSFIKRVIGLPGETVTITNGVVTIKNARNENEEGFTLSEPYIMLKKSDNHSITLGEGEYFVMGDNRAGSAESRSWGPVPEESIIGRPLLRFLPPEFLPGDSSHYEDN